MAQKNFIQFFGGNRSTKRPIPDEVSETLNPCTKQKIDSDKKNQKEVQRQVEKLIIQVANL